MQRKLQNVAAVKLAVMPLVITLLVAVLCVQAGAVTEIEELPYYIKENYDRYVMFHHRHPDLEHGKVVAYVNANVDKGFYNEIQQVENPDDLNVLVNKNFALPSDYEAVDFSYVDGYYPLRQEAADEFIRMKNDAAQQGLTLVVHSAYRSYWVQSSIYNRYVNSYGLEEADSQSARPGHSEHQLGLAVDMLQGYGYARLGYADFEDTAEYAWLTEHAHEYGFILRYPANYSKIHGYIYEPWHWRYIGVEAAIVMYNENIVTYEEYYGKYLAPGIVRDAEVEPEINSAFLSVRTSD